MLCYENHASAQASEASEASAANKNVSFYYFFPYFFSYLLHVNLQVANEARKLCVSSAFELTEEHGYCPRYYAPVDIPFASSGNSECLTTARLPVGKDS